MRSRAALSLLLCASLAAPGAAQTGAAAAAFRGMAIPRSIGLLAPVSPSLSFGCLVPSLTRETQTPLLLGAPLAAPAPLALPVDAAVRPFVFAAQVRAAAALAPAVSRSAAADRDEGEAFWSGAQAKAGGADPVTAVEPRAQTPRLDMAAGLMAPTLAVVPSWVSGAAPYAGAAAAVAGAYGVMHGARWAIDKAALKFGWDHNEVAMARFASSVAIWTAGVSIGLYSIGVPGTALLTTFGAGGTALALVVKDVVGNLFHGVHFLMSRPFTIGDKVTIGKLTGVVHDLTLRYMVLKDDEGGYILRTYSQIAAAPVALYGQYQTKAHRLTTAAKPAVPRGFLPALREAVTPALWKPLLFSGLAIAALSLFPAFRSGLESWAPKWVLASLPYVKAAVFGILTASVSRSVRSVIERLSQRNSWSRPMTTVLGLGASVLIWAIGGSFLLNAVGVSWASLGASLSISTILFGIAVLDYVNAIFQGALLLTLKPFRIGDQVRIGDHAGAVADITMQHVVLKVDEQSYMLIPHSVVKDSPIRTPREYGQRRN